ncbi:unnamed protein product [Hyaloperonospora brassicae]|uniref:Uncharacterized protein n=1 Tax=Hyaloperonospora brassicae TaxID=162125 RepID=A0AAV0TJI9_HYABA|nr:unnamed protein product [Hyaloperonospora brassicae]
MIVDTHSTLCLSHLPREPNSTAIEHLVQQPKAFPPTLKSTARPIRRVDRWRQVRLHMRQLTRGLKRCRARTVDGSNAAVTCCASMLHKDFWLEALDVQHRYGFHLRAFHRTWKLEMAREGQLLTDQDDASFFHWLDHGQGRFVDLPECSQQYLRSTRVEYCTEAQREDYEIEFALLPCSNEKKISVRYAASKQVVHTDDRSKWIFVLDLCGRLYLGRKRKGRFHHSSFVSGAPIFAAGKIAIAHGVIVAIEPHSGHFKPRLENLLALCCVLAKHGVDIEDVAFVKPKKWSCAWPFPAQPDVELSGIAGASDTDYSADRSDSDEAQPLLLPVD